MTTDQILYLMAGGGNGGERVTSGVDDAEYGLIVVQAGVTFTVLEDNEESDVMTAKNIDEYEFTETVVLGPGEGRTFMALTFTGGDVWGYTVPTSLI